MERGVHWAPGLPEMRWGLGVWGTVTRVLRAGAQEEGAKQGEAWRPAPGPRVSSWLLISACASRNDNVQVGATRKDLKERSWTPTAVVPIPMSQSRSLTVHGANSAVGGET